MMTNELVQLWPQLIELDVTLEKFMYNQF